MKFFKYSILIIACLTWIVALSPELSTRMTAYDSYRYGDLYRLSNLSKFKDLRKECGEYALPDRKPSNKKIHLYIIGDSFTEKQRVGKKDFAVDDYTYVNWSEVLHVKPDTSKINILLLESVERHFREKFTKAPVQNLKGDSATFIAKMSDPAFMHKLDNAFRSKSTEGRMDELLFQNDFVLALKQMKADFNYHVFNRVNKEVTRINDGKDIVYYMDTDTPAITSSFSGIRNSEIDSMVYHLNKTKEASLKLGFDQVILSIIPNKVSVLNPSYDTYNQLIHRIYSHPDLDIQYIDVYSDFRKLHDKPYLKGDSHWTCEGQYLWLDKTNDLIQRIAADPDL